MMKFRLIGLLFAICLMVSGLLLITQITPQLKLLLVVVVIISTVGMSIIFGKLRKRHN